MGTHEVVNNDSALKMDFLQYGLTLLIAQWSTFTGDHNDMRNEPQDIWLG
jgi:hypothetical protein